MPDSHQVNDTVMPIPFAEGMVRAAAMSGISVDQILLTEGIDLSKLPGLEISKIVKIVNGLLEQAPISTIFPIVRVINDEAINEMLMISSTSKNLIESAQKMMACGPFSALGLEISYQSLEEFDAYEVRASNPEGPVRRFLIEVAMAASLRFLPAQFQGLSVIEQVEFEFEQTDDWSEYDAYFGCPVKFNQPLNRIRLKKHTVTAEILSYSPKLLANAMKVLQEKTDTLLSLQGYRFRTSQVIKHLLEARIDSTSNGGLPNEDLDFSIENVARHLGLSVRGLQRKLKLEDASYVECKNQTLIEESKKWMDKGQTNLDQIAETLGYSDRAAFSKVFKKYTELWPAQYRKQ